MAKKYTDKFRRDAVQMATTSGLTRPQLSSDLGGWRLDAEQVGHQHHYVDLMSGPQKDVEKKIPAFAKNSGHCALRSKCGKTRDLLCSPKPMRFPFIDAWKAV
jgi:transposase